MKKLRESLIRDWKLHLMCALLTALLFTYKRIIDRKNLPSPLTDIEEYHKENREMKSEK